LAVRKIIRAHDVLVRRWRDFGQLWQLNREFGVLVFDGTGGRNSTLLIGPLCPLCFRLLCGYALDFFGALPLHAFGARPLGLFRLLARNDLGHSLAFRFCGGVDARSFLLLST
jgi:hypothetical protein